MPCLPLQPYLPEFGLDQPATQTRSPKSSGRKSSLPLRDSPLHDWYRFVLAFPPGLVRDYIEDFNLDGRHVLLDPFCGTGTTLVEAKLHGIEGIGLEANPFAHFATTVKVRWDIDPHTLVARSHDVAHAALDLLRSQGIDDMYPFSGDIRRLSLRTLDLPSSRLVIKNSISPLPLHKTLVLLDLLKADSDKPCYQHQRLALAAALVSSVSNLRFGPEVGAGRVKRDAPVVAAWLSRIDGMANDLHSLVGRSFPKAQVYLADARSIADVLQPDSVDAVITSPPYPNEKDYSRTTRLESVILGFITNKAELRATKKTFVRSNTRSVYKGDTDDAWVAQHGEVQRIATEIETRRVALGKTSGFEKLYSKVTRLYFGGMARHLAELRVVLRPGARLAYVLGDQASYLRVMIRTGHLLADIAQQLGYQLQRIDLFRTRFATATRKRLREEVVVLRWPG